MNSIKNSIQLIKIEISYVINHNDKLITYNALNTIKYHTNKNIKLKKNTNIISINKLSTYNINQPNTYIIINDLKFQNLDEILFYLNNTLKLTLLESDHYINEYMTKDLIKI